MQNTISKSVMRPRLASRLVHFSMAYITIFEGLQAFGYGDGADWELLGLILTQPVAWVTGRTIEKTRRIEDV